MTRFLSSSQFQKLIVLTCMWAAAAALPVHAQEAQPAPSTAGEPKPQIVASKDFPARIELLETRFRFETSGDSRKEVHALVKINSELGARQFARLTFDYDRGFQRVEIPFVRITHASGGTVDILPSAVTDAPNPAVVDFPAYHDVRVRSARILGLQPGDKLEYRVVTTTTHHPLAPDFWLDHSFDRTGVVSEESFEIELPAGAKVQIHINPATPALPPDDSRKGDLTRTVYRWRVRTPGKSTSLEQTAYSTADVELSTFDSWQRLADRLSGVLGPSEKDLSDVRSTAKELVGDVKVPRAAISAVYDFVSQKIKTVDLPLGATGFHLRPPSETLKSGYGTAEDKHVLFAALGNNFFGPARAGLVTYSRLPRLTDLAMPSKFEHILTMSGYPSVNFWMDLSVEVAPFGMIPSQFRGQGTFLVGPAVDAPWQIVSNTISFTAAQKVSVDAAIATDGRLTAKVKYTMRGDNELLLRVAFHQSPKEKWKDIAQLLALSDGFRGQVTSASASDPYATNEPFSVEYEIVWPKFVDWSKKPSRIPVLLPQISLPDLPARPSAGAPAQNIDLGTPLEVETQVTLRLPAGATASAPPGTSVSRDYATFSSTYSAQGATVTASRKVNFLLRELPAARAADYSAFLHAVQSDQSQFFTAVLSGNPPVAEPTPK